MLKPRKGRVSNLHVDWVAKGLDLSKDTDGHLASSDASPEADLNLDTAAESLKGGPPLADYISGKWEAMNLGQQQKGHDYTSKTGLKHSTRRGYRVKTKGALRVSRSPREELIGTSQEKGAAELNESHVTEEKDVIKSSSCGDDIHGTSLEEISNSDDGGMETQSTNALASGSEERQFPIERKVVKWLRELAASADVSKLSESQLESNNQEQQDEVVALQAIYEGDFVLLETEEGEPRTYLISIFVEHPESLNVTVNLSFDSSTAHSEPCSSTSASSHGSVSGKLHACTLRHLPPIQLICALPKSYPSHGPPIFALQTRWLNPVVLSSLCKGLDSFWEEQTGQVVVYAWAEWLHSSALSYLGISDELELSSSMGTLVSQDNRAVSSFTSPDIDVPWLIRYNEEQRNEEFCTAVHLCYICFTEQPGKNFVRLPCKHFFCYPCMREYSSVHVKEGTVNRLNCPDTSCRVPMPPPLLKQLLGEEDFQRWEHLLLQKTLDSMVDVVYCPRCETVCIEEEDHHVLCGRCFFSFCSICNGPWHVGQACLSAESRLRILQERQKGYKAGEDQRRKEQDLVNELLNLKYVQREAKQCPACKIAIAKSEGCNKMICGNCGQYFCYRCNKAIDGYEHFREACTLFDQEEIQNWERMMNDRQREGQARIELFPQLGRPCPNCGQANIKEGKNNHIFCWSCQNHYCALCRKMVRRSSEHYGSGPNKCKQHTIE